MKNTAAFLLCGALLLGCLPTLATQGGGEPPPEWQQPQWQDPESIPQTGPEGANSAENTLQDQPVTVGLFYGDSALDGANLLNEVGTGYRFGYFDGQRQFQQVGTTSVKGISVVMTRNVWYGTSTIKNPWSGNSENYTSYFDDISSDILVGCFHVQLPGAYHTFEDAQAAADSAGGFVTWTGGEQPYLVRVGSYATREEAQAAANAAGGVLGETSAYGMSVVKSGSSTILFQFDMGEGGALCVLPGLDDSIKTTTWFKGYRFYGGFRYQRVERMGMTVSSFLPLEEYINCVVSREMSRSWPIEALKAQAVCARTYYEINLGRHNDYGVDICCSTHCQAYYGMGSTDENTARAARETAGLRAWYDGQLVETYYFSSDGGLTEQPKYVWGTKKEMPYLQGVQDTYETSIADYIQSAYGSRRYRWSYTYTRQQLADLLQSWGYPCQEVVDFRVSEYTPAGNPATLTFTDGKGSNYSFSTSRMVSRLGLSSYCYTLSGGGQYYVDEGDTISSVTGAYVVGADGMPVRLGSEEMPYIITETGVEQMSYNGGDTYTIQGAGWGHNIGMSQWGAYAMAQQGKTFDEILKFYYTGIELY